MIFFVQVSHYVLSEYSIDQRVPEDVLHSTIQVIKSCPDYFLQIWAFGNDNALSNRLWSSPSVLMESCCRARFCQYPNGQLWRPQVWFSEIDSWQLGAKGAINWWNILFSVPILGWDVEGKNCLLSFMLMLCQFFQLVTTWF